MTLAQKLGTTPHISPLLVRARRLGMEAADALESLAVARGCWHYRHPEMVPAPNVLEGQFGNEELAMALLSPCQPYSPHTIRVGAAMLGAAMNEPQHLAHLAVMERCVPQVRYVAQAGLGFEPDNSFWRRLLDHLPAGQEPKDGVMPHPTRFVSMTGITRAGAERVTVWVRPRSDQAIVHG